MKIPSSVLAGFVVSILVVGGGSFYGGMKYAQSKNTGRGMGAFANLTPEQRQTRFAQAGGPGGQGGNRAAGGFVTGEVLSRDEGSVTVKLRDGGSKIVFVSDKTQVMKSADGSISDVIVGSQVMITGTANADGSVSAQTVQLRPVSVANPDVK